jgi:hypothetical protein
VQGEGESGGAFDESRRVVVRRPYRAVEQCAEELVQVPGDALVLGLGCGAFRSRCDAGPSVAERTIADEAGLGRVGQAPGEGTFGGVLAGGVGEREPGELLGSRDASLGYLMLSTRILSVGILRA